ncbi:MAG: hypothetical protein ACRDSL_22610 [Pseudonocardiaceae bacterium]
MHRPAGATCAGTDHERLIDNDDVPTYVGMIFDGSLLLRQGG